MERLITWFSRQWATLGPSQKVSFVTIGLLLVVATIIAVTMLMTPDWQTLYGELSPQDAGAMRAKLSDLGIASRVNASGTVIEVPSAQVGRARIELASAGLPKDQVGLEILRNPPLGATQETIKDMRQMGLQGELSRTFRALDSVRYASVQLVLPEEGLFAEQNREATAVVVLGLRPGASLDSRQIAGMVHLLTHSIPELKPENVSITDTSRGLLAIGSDYASGAAGYGVPLTEMQEARQKSYEKQVQGLLDTAFGAGNSRVAVHLEMDLTKKDTKKTVHTPVGTPGESGYEQKTVKGQGRAGAEETETTSTTQPLVSEQRTTERTTQDGGTEKTESTRTFDPTYNTEETTEVVPPGQVKGVSVAIILDAAIVKPKPEEGSEEGTAPAKLTPRELAKKTEDAKGAAETIAVNALGLKTPPAGTAEADVSQFPDRVSVSMVDFDRSAQMAMQAAQEEAAGADRMGRYTLYGKIVGLLLLGFLVWKLWIAKMIGRAVTSVERYGAMAPVGPAAAGAAPAGREGAPAAAAKAAPAGAPLSYEEAVDRDLDAITTFAKQRPETVALLLKSWLIEGSRR